MLMRGKEFVAIRLLATFCIMVLSRVRHQR